MPEFVQVNIQKTTAKKKRTYFLKNYIVYLFTFFKKLFAFCKSFPTWFFRCKDLRRVVFYLFEVQSTVLISPSLQGRNALI